MIGDKRKVIKRNGKKVKFNVKQIEKAIWGAAEAVGGDNKAEADLLAAEVNAHLGVMFYNQDMTPTVVQINDLVEKRLMENGHSKTAKAFILYRDQHKKIREMRSSMLDTVDLIGKYVDNKDWRSAENANSSSITFPGLNARVSGEALERFALNEMYDGEIRKNHELGNMHIHDLSYPVIGYCAGWGLEDLLKRGFGEVPNRIQSAPAKHMDTTVIQMVNYVGTMQGEFAGAQAFSSVDTLLAQYVRVDNLSKKEIKQNMQKLIYGLNVPSRWGWQAPFSNLSFDLVVPKDLKDKEISLNLTPEEIEKRLANERNSLEDKFGDSINVDEHIEQRRETLTNMIGSTYGDYQEEMNLINEAFLELSVEGDKDGRPFTFPIPTYSITSDFDWDSNIADKIFEVAGLTGAPYFQNYVGTGRDSSEVRAMCCRLQLDQVRMNEHVRRSGGMWSMGANTGSIGVVSINMNRVGYDCKGKSEEEFFSQLEHLMELARDSLEIKRDIVESGVEKGFVPYTKSYLGNFDNHFSTIGTVGMHEMCMNYLGKGIETKEGNEFANKVLDFMVEKTNEYSDETTNLYNVEAAPAESTAYRFAKKDKELYGDDIFTSGDKVPFLTNSSMLPVDHTSNLGEALELQEELQSKYTGGTLFNMHIPEPVSKDSAKAIIKKAMGTKIPYFSLTPVFSICPDHGRMSGEHFKCPTCGTDAEVYTRVTGYIRPVSSFNAGKGVDGEYGKRVTYDSKKFLEEKVM